MNLKNDLSELLRKLEGVEAQARKLRNQNCADVAKSAAAKIRQLSDHPDLHLVQDEMGGRKDQTLNPDGSPRANFRDAPFPGAEIGGPDRGKPDTHVPGEPQFDRPNENFQQPNAVDLNADGTLKQAPNSLGQSDVRES